jgi:hypothetical protein
MAKVEKMLYCCGISSPYLKCSGQHMESEFFTSWNPLHAKTGKLPYCKSCCNKLTEYYLNIVNNIEGALWLTCATVGVPFMKEVYEEFSKRNNINPIKNNYFGLYMNCFLKHSTKSNDWKDFSATNVGFESVTSIIKSQEKIRQEADRFLLDWGEQSVEDYQYLEFLFEKYTEDIELTPYQEDLFRDLCLARLQKRRIENGKIKDGDIQKVESQILVLMNKLKVDNFKDDKPKTLSEQLIFDKIAMVENEMPCERYKDKDKYKDYNGLDEYFKRMILRPLLNTLAGNRDFDIPIKDIDKYNI